MKLIVRFVCVIFFIFSLHAKPKVTVVIVIDQFAEHYVKKLEPYWHAGLHDLFTHGIVFTNAHQPHGIPATAVGHTGLATGVLPNVHGIVDNVWYDDAGKKVHAYKDVFSRVPTINKIFMHINPHNRAIALSYKQRSALAMAGKEIPALWLSEENGLFISSQKTPSVDEVLTTINRNPLLKPHPLNWPLTYKDSQFYDPHQFPFIKDYSFASAPSLIGRSAKKSDFLFALEKMPMINELLLSMALEFIEQELPSLADGSLLLWVSLSSLDKLGHVYGPQSLEAIDTLYHFDKYIGDFMHKLQKIVNPKDTLYVLTADHGVLPIPEIAQKMGLKSRRLIRNTELTKLNTTLQKEFNIPNAVTVLDPPFIVINHEKIKSAHQEETVVTQRIKELLEQVPGIKKVYTPTELFESHPHAYSSTALLQNQLYPGRTSDLIIEVTPGTLFSKYEHGTGHNTPDEANTHIPLVIYQAGTFENKKIIERVTAPQLASTLQELLTGIPAHAPMLQALLT